jgi:hypothetical protein
MELQPLQVRLNARPAFERTTVECRSHVRTYSPTAREVRVALSGPIVHRFNLAPWAIICVQTHLVRSNALRLNATPTLERTRHYIATTAERTSRRANACASAFERTPDLVARFILSINKIFCILCFFTFGRRP